MYNELEHPHGLLNMVVENKKWLFGIRNRILIFTFIVTLIPSLGLGWLFYSQTQQLLWEKVELELRNTINSVAQEIELWSKKSSFNISVFSNSFVITENLEQFLSSKDSNDRLSSDNIPTSIKKITNYLKLVQAEFDEYNRFILLNNNGKVITQSHALETAFTLPENWRIQLEKNSIIISEAKSDKKFHESYLTIIVPVLSNKNSQIGLFATELKIKGIKKIFRSFPIPEHSNLLLLKEKGIPLLSTMNKQAQVMPHLNSSDLTTLLKNPIKFSIYTNADDEKVIGYAKAPNNFPWTLLIEKNYDQAFAEIIALKQRTFMIIILLISIFGVIAYLVSQSILCPLKQLISGASQVASGDLDIKLPSSKNDELGFAISVFNDMVQRLRQNHEEKEKLLRVDALTGLYNRKHMMEILDFQLERFHRNLTPFSIIMADLDHFKQINDNYGHQIGDMVLTRTGSIFREVLRAVDTAGRYGGEEFIIILDEAGEQEAVQTAKRLRKAIEDSEIFIEGTMIKFTTSMGIATISNSKETEESLISRADKALYQAKASGRNRVCLSDSNVVSLTQPEQK